MYADRLKQIEDKCSGDYSLTEEEREFLTNAYWNGNQNDICSVLTILCYDPSPNDMPVLLDASSPTSWWVNRCDAAQAFGGLGDAGQQVLRIMLQREKTPIVRFYVFRELIDLGDELCLPFLDGSIPANASPGRRSLWIYGNFERTAITKESALDYMRILRLDKKLRHEWLLKHIENS